MTDVWQSAKIVSISDITPRIKSFLFQLPRAVPHIPGQHYDVRLTAPDGYRAIRSYSVASAPNDSGLIELAIDRLDEGEVSGFFHEVAQVDDEIELRGPLGGHFIWQPTTDGSALLIGGGSGVVPLMSMVRNWSQGNFRVAIAVLLSATTSAQAPYVQELRSISAEKPRFTFRLTLTRETPAFPMDLGGHIDARMVRDIVAASGKSPDVVCVCGSNGFVSAAMDSLEGAGIAGAIKTERYGG